MKKDRAEVKAFVDQLAIMTPLNPRDAFCGGRTNAVKLYHHVEESEEIDYYDYTSLYPYMNKNGEYPLGHPEIIFQPGYFDIALALLNVLCYRPTSSIIQCCLPDRMTS